MKTTDLFKFNKKAHRLNEGLAKVFGTSLRLESFDLPQLHDARNKIRTQISQIKSQSGFNETLTNNTYQQAQFMLDTLNSEISERSDSISQNALGEISDKTLNRYLQGAHTEIQGAKFGRGKGTPEGEKTIDKREKGMSAAARRLVARADARRAAAPPRPLPTSSSGPQDWYGKGRYMGDSMEQSVAEGTSNFTPDDIAKLQNINDIDAVKTQAFKLISTPSRRPMRPEKIEWFKNALEKKQDKNSVIKLMYDLLLSGEGAGVIGTSTSMRQNSYRRRFTDSVNNEQRHNAGQLNNTQHTPKDYMTRLHEGEIQQASAIVTAKTMVDRVGRWIEELSGMENDTLLQLGDSIRDEMGHLQAKQYVSTVAPAIQQALEHLKLTRETLASSVRTLTGEEQAAEMLGSPALPDLDTADLDSTDLDAPDLDAPDLDAMGDQFSAADAAAGGAESAGRAQRESINFENRLLRVLAG